MENNASQKPAAQGRVKFIIGGLLIVAAVIYLILSSTQANAQYFLTVEELVTRDSEVVGRDVRVSGAVLGETITYDTQTLDISFTIVHIPGDMKDIDALGGIAKVLHDATNDPALARIQIVYNGVKPDLLKNEAQAIVTGELGEDGIFYASELLLKCPTKYEDTIPEQVSNPEADNRQ